VVDRNNHRARLAAVIAAGAATLTSPRDRNMPVKYIVYVTIAAISTA